MEVRPFLRRVGARRLKGLGLPAWEFPLEKGNPGFPFSNLPIRLIEIINIFNRKPKTQNRKPYKGLAVVTGLGPDAARRAAQILFPIAPRLLVSLGFGGALTSELAPGDLVLGESVWDFQPDTGVLAELPIPLPPRPLSGLIQELNLARLPAVSGSLVTTPYIIHKKEQGKPLNHLSRPVVDLETGVWAQVAAAQGLGFLGLRAITDTASEEMPGFIKTAQGTLGEALGWLARDPTRIWTLIHLWRRSRLAARRLGAAMAVLLPLVT
ncbi:MAG: hypothetical protein FJ134_16125 [Deltaproteobacteria bacterium]|nr:hypothetical protein [Deltaproteobacteria bacterium]